MSLPAQQYAAMRGALRGALSANDPLAPNPSDREVLGFFGQLFSDASGATIPAAELPAVSIAAARLLTSNNAASANPTDADVVTFWGQLNTDASGAAQLSARRYLALRAALRGALSANYPGISNPSEADMLGYFGQYGTPAALTLAGGGVGWWDSDYSGGAADGATVVAFANRIAGSNAQLATMTGAVGCTLLSTGWRASRTQSCWKLANQALRATGSDVVNTASGLGKTWTWLLVWVPRMTSNTTQYAAGFDLLSAATFTNSCGITRTVGPRFTWGAYNAAAETVDTALINQNAQILEVTRPTATQIQFGINNVLTPAVTFGSGTTFNVDGWSVGGWSGNGGANNSVAGDAYVRSAILLNKPLAGADRAALYSYLASVYSGFETTASLGAT